MRSALLVAAGGALGSWARWTVGGWVQRRAAATNGVAALFPAGTLAVNLIGCFAIGVVASLVDERGALGPGWRIFLLIGVLGGFTTFSSFGFETVALARAGNLALAMANVLLSVTAGLLGVWSGSATARWMVGAGG